MASALNKVTSEYINRGIPKNADLGTDWIINPTDEDKEQYKYVAPIPTEAELALQELQTSDGEMARIVEELVDYVVNGTPISDVAKDKVNARKVLRSKL